MLNDQTIIDNTHFREEGGKLLCYTNLPDGDKFEQAVSNQEAVQKNMIGWCNTVRQYIEVKQEAREEEQARKKLRRKQGMDTPAEPETPPQTPSEAVESTNPKELVLRYWGELQDEKLALEDQLECIEARLEEIEEERDELGPVIRAWKGAKGET